MIVALLGLTVAGLILAIAYMRDAATARADRSYMLGWGHGLAYGRRLVAVPSPASSSESTAGRAADGTTIGFGGKRAAS